MQTACDKNAGSPFGEQRRERTHAGAEQVEGRHELTTEVGREEGVEGAGILIASSDAPAAMRKDVGDALRLMIDGLASDRRAR